MATKGAKVESAAQPKAKRTFGLFSQKGENKHSFAKRVSDYKTPKYTPRKFSKELRSHANCGKKLRTNRSFFGKKLEKFRSFGNKTAKNSQKKHLKNRPNPKQSIRQLFRNQRRHRKIKTGSHIDLLRKTKRGRQPAHVQRATHLAKTLRQSPGDRSNGQFVIKVTPPGQSDRSRGGSGRSRNNKSQTVSGFYQSKDRYCDTSHLFKSAEMTF